MTAKMPWFPFYGRDFFGDEAVKLFSARQIGFYVNLLWHQWEHGSIPHQSECMKFPIISRAIYEATRVQPESNGRSTEMCEETICHEVGAIFDACFKPLPRSHMRFYNQRLELIRQEQLEEAEKRRAHAMKAGLASAAARVKNGSNVGPTPVEPESTPSQPNQNQNPSSPNPKKDSSKRFSSDTEWLEELRGDPNLNGIDFDLEERKARVWIKNRKGRKFTRDFFTNWLIKAMNEKPITAAPPQKERLIV